MIKKTAFVLLFITLILNCKADDNYKKYTQSSFSMGTLLEITIFSTDEAKVKKILDESMKLSNQLEDKFSCHKDSIITKLNKEKSLIINDNEVLDLLIKSKYLSKLSKGNFDLALFNITELWGFSSGDPKLPDNNIIKNELKKTGYTNVIINKKEVKLLNGVSLDLGGVAKGRIINLIAVFLKQNGFKDFIINGGGDLIVSGKFQNIRPWRIAIVDPFDKNDFLGFIALTDKSIVTSGDYERSFIKDGVNYHHIIDPKTGYPSTNEVHSVTVISSDSTKADAMATAVFVMGEKKGIEFANKTDDLDVIIITGDKDNKKISYSNKITAKKTDKGKWEFTYRD